MSEIVLDHQGSGVSLCITQITLHNIQVVLVFKQKSWNTNYKQTNLAPVVYNYWHNFIKVNTTKISEHQWNFSCWRKENELQTQLILNCILLVE